MSGLDFTAARAGASAALGGDSATTSTPVPATSTSSPVPSSNDAVSGSVSPASETPAPQATQPELVEWELEDGSKVQVDKRLQPRLMQHKDYTQKTQTLAEEKRQLTQFQTQFQQMQQERQQFAGLLQNPQELARVLYETHGDAGLQALAQMLQGQEQPQGINENEVLTAGQMQQMMQQERQRHEAELQRARQDFQRELKEGLTATEQQIAFKREVQQYAGAFDSHVDSLFNNPEYELATDLPNAEDNLRYEVLQRKPASIDEAKAIAVEVLGQWQAKEEAKVTKRLAASAAKNASLAATGIEPPGGAPVSAATPQQNYNRKTNKIDWSNIQAQVKTRI